MSSQWDTTFKSLEIPPEYARFQSVVDDPETLNSLDTWRSNIHLPLGTLQGLVAQKRLTGEQIDDATLANIVFYVSPYALVSEADGLDLAPWSTQQTRYIAQEILSIPQISQPTTQLLRQILSNKIKPIFSSNPHPYVNPTSGRKLSRPAGGPGASQDYYDDQIWKNYPGIWSVIARVARDMHPEVYGECWHLLIPPIMTLLDDYQAKHKLEGVKIVALMLHRIPRDIFQRTGIDGLIFTSLKTALSHITDPETHTLLQLSISTWMNLTLRVTQPNSAERFNHLCTLLGNGIIEGIWMYSNDNAVAMKATLEALPDLIRALDIGTVRFLKSLIPQLAHLLATRSPSSPQSVSNFDNVDLQRCAGRVLSVIIEVCSPRMEGWKFTILDCVARCWVGLVDSSDGAIDEELQNILRELMSRLVGVCPDISQDAYKALLMEDPSMFGGLVGTITSPAQPVPTNISDANTGFPPG